MNPTFRRYSPNDRDDCVAVFSSNIPKYFREHERPDFESFIDSGQCPYFVLEVSDRIIGCGGFAIREPGADADLCWGMIASTHHSRRFGEFLLLGRLLEILEEKDVPAVRLGTSQHTDGFFQRYGFRVHSREPDGIADGLDDVEMRLDLTRDIRQSIADRWRLICSP